MDKLEYLQKFYPNTDNKVLAKYLGISEQSVRRVASKYNIKKSKEYMKKQHELLLKAKEAKYLSSIRELHPTNYQLNIIIDSILGDGNSSYAPRSKNAYYRDHFFKNNMNVDYGMDYKWNIDKRILKESKNDRRINLSNFYSRKFLSYTNEEIDKIIDLKKRGFSDKEIADKLNRTYWGIVWKIRVLKAKNMS
ncbi:hypothetical protein V7D15_00020 [Thermoanaerobacter thermohydrosulfuricus]|nr:hypothetical protein [Thermoanaerobacterium sp.]